MVTRRSARKDRTGLEVVLVRIAKNGTTVPVPLARQKTLVGRLDDCHIRVPVAGISRKHCEFVVDDDSVELNDLDSSNGTFVNQARINSVELEAGDLVSFGGLVFVVKIDGAPSKIDAQSLFKQGLPVVEPTDGQVPAPTESPKKSTPMTVPETAIGDMSDDSSMMDFEFDFDDDEEQPPL